MMQFDEFKKEVSGLSYAELREDSKDYFEAVISKGALPGLIQKLEDFFGAPCVLSAGALSAKTNETINALGGIGPGQTFYFKEGNDNEIFLAMLWPWQSGSQITVKISRQGSNSG